MTKSDRDLPSHVYQTRNRYFVAQYVNKERVVYGRYDTREEAIQRRNQLIHDGVIQDRKKENRYISKKNRGYFIQKRINDVVEYFGMFRTLEDAREERDFLESINWDYDNMDDGIRKWGGYEYDEVRP